MLSTLTGSLSSIRAKVSSFVGITDLTKTFTKYETSIVAANEKIENLGRNVSVVKDRLFQVDVTLHDFIQNAPALAEIDTTVQKIVDNLYERDLVDLSAIRRTVAASVESTLNDFSFRDVLEDCSVSCSFADDYGHSFDAMSTEVDNTGTAIAEMSNTVNAHTETLERIEMSLREIRGILNDLHRASGVTPEKQQQMIDVMLPRTWVKTEDNWKVVQ